ncbi:hypothetical protein [Streptomyces sp. SID8352]|uniref:hypothetical protein n=1 Tax=Streptomyces sp. SID8352 TaxID=2690338 RepID=UPI0013718DE2|nr:hypothetical protein [Streptomyces sp. SID8352]
MTADSRDTPAARPPESGWSKARHPHDRGAPRTWVPAVDDGDAPRARRRGAESHIVRGED